MPRAYLISLLVLTLLVCGLAKREFHTAAELLPVSSALNWVEGRGRALDTGLTGAGIRPAHVIHLGRGLVPRTPPVMQIYYGAMVRIFRDTLGRLPDGADLKKLSWLINVVGVLPWALLIFGAMVRLGVSWGLKKGPQACFAALAAIAGSATIGWMGQVSEYLPVAALGAWSVVLLLDSRDRPSSLKIGLAGLLAGIAGAWHPSGWFWVIWGILLLFIADSETRPHASATSLTLFVVGSLIGVVASCAGNLLFFGTPLPVQMIDLLPPGLLPSDFARLLWHDLAGLNGILWISPLIIPGVFALTRIPVSGMGEGSQGNDHSPLSSPETASSVVRFLLGLSIVVLLVWGIMENASIQAETRGLRPEFKLMPIELVDGKFSIVQLGQVSGSQEDRRAYVERLYSRTDVFLSFDGRPAGLPVMLPIALIVGLLGWIELGRSRFWSGYMWVGVRSGALVALIISQAPYGSAADAFIYTGAVVGAGNMPVIEALSVVADRLAVLWPSGVVKF